MDFAHARRALPYVALFVLATLAGFAVTLSVPLWAWAGAAGAFGLSALLFRYAPTLAGRRSQIAVALAVVLLVLAPSIVAAAHIAGSVPVERDVPLTSIDNTTVVVDGNTNALLEEFYDPVINGTVDVTTEAGNMTVFSLDGVEVWVTPSNITGTYTNVTQIDVGGGTIDLNPEDKQEITVGKNIGDVAWRDDTQADDGVVDFAYSGDGGGGDSRVVLRNVSANTNLLAIDADTGNILDFAVSDGSGVVDFDTLTNSDHAVLLQQGTPADPVLSNPQPTGPQTSQPTSFSVDVNDSDFSKGDSVTAELFVEQVSQGTDSLSSNGTATVSHTPDLGKSIDYSWVATDSFGERDTINATLTTPVNVTFREEHNASKIITGVNATITLYSVDATTIVTRSDDNEDGNITLEGLPDKEFVAVAQSDDHYTRRVYIQSIFNQQNIFLLNKTEVPGDQAINTTFVFEDRTGEFPAENTTLRIQRGLDVNNDNTSEWLTVAGDFWGAASEFPFTGEENARYRLIVENRDGDRRILGTHIPVEDGIKTVINGEIRWRAENATGRVTDAVLNQSDQEIEAFYTDPSNNTDSVRIQVYELGNASNEIFDQNFTSGPYGTIANDPLVALTGDQPSKSWVVRWTYDHDGETDTSQLTVGAPQVGLPMDPWLLAAFAFLGITFVGTLYGPRTATLGAWAMVMVVLGITAFGLAPIPMPSVVAGVLVAGGGTLYREGLP